MLLAVSLVILAVVVASGLLVFKRLDIWQSSRLEYYSQLETETKDRLAKALEEKRALDSRLGEMETQISLAGWKLEAPSGSLPPGMVPPKRFKRPLTTDERNDRLSRWLIKNGKVTVEQHEKALKLVGKIGNDVVETCLLLNFIDAETAREALNTV